jgi:cytochrome c-type biogenesis protein CcmF
MIGNIFLTFAFLASLFSCAMFFLSYKGYSNTLKYARISFHATAVSVIVSSALLLHAIITHQYQYGYVYNYSGSDLPVGLLISTFYAGQEGSFLLWAFFTSIIGLVLLDYTSKRGDLEQRVMMVFTLALGFLLFMLSPLLKSPFNYIWTQPSFIEMKHLNPALLSMPFIQNFIMTDQNTNQFFINMNKELYAALTANGLAVKDLIIQGKGLNPLLQNFWMQIHPPILFVGFSMSLVPFTFAMAAVIKNEYKEWVKQSLPWLLTGSMVLGLAIMLGGYWAYGVLGWGGYWGWDPVENSSLVPWIVSIAALHTMLVQKKTEEKGGGSRFVKTNLILSILTYVLVLYSTFLTRSGILGDASVHSFVDPGMMVYWFLIFFFGVFTVMGIGGIIYRWKYLMKNFNFEENILSRELALFTGSAALIASAIIVLVGTSAPIFGKTVETRFYNEANLPIAIIIGLLNGLSLLLKWKQTDKKDLFGQLRSSLIASAALTIITALLGGMHSVLFILFVFSCYFTLVVNGEMAYRILKGKKLYLGGYIAHAGFAIFLLGVLATSGYSETAKVDLIKGKQINVLGHDVKFTGVTPFDNGRKYNFNIEMINGSRKNIISPVMFRSEMNNSLMREPDILAGFTKDFYVAPLGYSDGTEEAADKGTQVTIEKGKSYEHNDVKITFTEFNFPDEARSAMMAGTDFQIGAKLKISFGGKENSYEAVMKTAAGNTEYIPVDVKEANLRITMQNMDASGKVVLNIADLDKKEEAIVKAPEEVLTVEASVKPFISLVWLGVLLTVMGLTIAAVRRAKESLN